MRRNQFWGMLIAGFCAGAVNGLLGAGGGMVLVPLLTLLTPLEDNQVFSTSIAIILPLCIVSIIVTAITGSLFWQSALPYLIGSTAGGIIAGLWGQRIPAKWLHRILGILIIWGGIRYLC